MRHSAEAVDESLAVSVERSVVADVVEFAVEQHTLRASRHVSVGEVHLEVALHGTVLHEGVAREMVASSHLLGIHIGELVVLQFGDSLVENLLISLVAKILHESALLGAKQVARTAYVEVLHGEIEAAAQFGEVLQSLKAASCLGREHRLRRRKQVAERLAVGTSNATAHLVKVGESEAVGVVDDDGVGVAYVDAVLDDGRREQHVVVVVHEADENLLKLLGRHLSVSDSHTRVGHVFLYERSNLGQVADAVVDEEHLSVARHLEVDGVGYYLMSVHAQFGLHGVAVGRRRAHDAHVASAHQRELQRARYRRSRHRERVDVGLQLAQLLLCRHTELLLLVDDEQSEVVPLHSLSYQLVRANEYVYLARLKVGKHLACLLRRAGTREIVDTHRHVLQTL